MSGGYYLLLGHSNIAIHLSLHRKDTFFAEHTLRPGDGERSKDV